MGTEKTAVHYIRGEGKRVQEEESKGMGPTRCEDVNMFRSDEHLLWLRSNIKSFSFEF